MSNAYKGGKIPPDLDPKMKKFVEDVDRYLTKGVQSGPIEFTLIGSNYGGAKTPDAPIKYIVLPYVMNLGWIKPQKTGTVAVFRFPNLPTLKPDSLGGNLKIHGQFNIQNRNATITMVCDGKDWYEVARSYGGSDTDLKCPTIINRVRNNCAPIFDVYGWTGHTDADGGPSMLTVLGSGVGINKSVDIDASLRVGFTSDITLFRVDGDVGYNPLMEIRGSDETVHFGGTTGTNECNFMMRTGFGNTITYKRTATAVNYSVSDTDFYIGVTAVSPSVPRTITLPAANSTYAESGRTVVIKDESGNCSGATPIRIARSGADLIDGLTFKDISSPYGSRTCVSNGTDAWYLY